jgi:hypothetical protein
MERCIGGSAQESIWRLSAAMSLRQLCVPKIRFGNIGGEVHGEPAVK